MVVLVVLVVLVVGGGVGRNLLDDPMLRRGALLVFELNLDRGVSHSQCGRNITWMRMVLT